MVFNTFMDIENQSGRSKEGKVVVVTGEEPRREGRMEKERRRQNYEVMNTWEEEDP